MNRLDVVVLFAAIVVLFIAIVTIYVRQGRKEGESGGYSPVRCICPLKTAARRDESWL